MTNIKEIGVEEYKKVAKSDSLAVVWLYANWCGPCKHFHPTFEAVAEEFVGEVEFLKYNVDQGPVGGNIQGIPTVRFFQKGEIIKELVGAQDKNFFRSVVENYKTQK